RVRQASPGGLRRTRFATPMTGWARLAPTAATTRGQMSARRPSRKPRFSAQGDRDDASLRLVGATRLAADEHDGSRTVVRDRAVTDGLGQSTRRCRSAVAGVDAPDSRGCLRPLPAAGEIEPAVDGERHGVADSP